MKNGMVQKLSIVGVIVLAMALLGGCARLPPPDPNNPIAKVAVLPMQNMTSDMDGAVWVREGINQMMPTRHYSMMPLEQVDQVLRDKMGVTLGGQIDYTNQATGAPMPGVVGTNLEVDGLLYCKLEDFSNLVTGFYNRRKVKAACRLVNVKTEAVVWEKVEEQSHSEVNLSVSGAIDAVKQKAIAGLVNSALRTNPLKVETAVVIQKMAATLPSGPVVVTAGK